MKHPLSVCGGCGQSTPLDVLQTLAQYCPACLYAVQARRRNVEAAFIDRRWGERREGFRAQRDFFAALDGEVS